MITSTVLRFKVKSEPFNIGYSWREHPGRHVRFVRRLGRDGDSPQEETRDVTRHRLGKQPVSAEAPSED